MNEKTMRVIYTLGETIKVEPPEQNSNSDRIVLEDVGRNMARHIISITNRTPLSDTYYVTTWRHGEDHFPSLQNLKAVDRKVAQLRGIVGYYSKRNSYSGNSARYVPVTEEDVMVIERTMKQYLDDFTARVMMEINNG